MSFSCPVPSSFEAKAISDRKNIWNLRINGILVYFSFCLLCNTPSNALFGASLEAQMAKNLPAMWETQVQSLGWEDPLEKEWLPNSAFLLGEFHRQRNLVSYSPCGHKESDTTEQLTLLLSL